MKIAAFVVLLLALPLVAQAQTKRELILITAECKDSVGSTVLFQFKEAVRMSVFYTLDPPEPPSGKKHPIWVEMVCIDASLTPSAPATAISITAHFNRLEAGACLLTIPLYHGVRYTTVEFAKETAVGILADIDAENSKQASNHGRYLNPQ